MTSRATKGHGKRRSIDGFNAKDIESRKSRWLLLANVHELHKEVTVISESAILDVHIELSPRALDAFGVRNLAEIFDDTCSEECRRVGGRNVSLRQSKVERAKTSLWNLNGRGHQGAQFSSGTSI
jgi:hypothetical protein